MFINIDYPNVDGVFLSFRWGHGKPGFDVQYACVQQEDHSRLLMYYLL